MFGFGLRDGAFAMAIYRFLFVPLTLGFPFWLPGLARTFAILNDMWFDLDADKNATTHTADTKSLS